MIACGDEAGSRRFGAEIGAHMVCCSSPRFPPEGTLLCLCSLTKAQLITVCNGHLGNQKSGERRESAGRQTPTVSLNGINVTLEMPPQDVCQIKQKKKNTYGT